MSGLVKVGLMALIAVACALAPLPAASQPVKGTYVYSLSGFTGTIPYNSARLTVDREQNEIYVLYQNAIRIFNESGMEVYRFGEDLDVGQILDVAVEEGGSVLLLTYRDSKTAIIRCNYRGEPESEVTLKGLPSRLSNFVPNRMLLQRGQLYLASTSALVIVVTDSDGNIAKAYDLIPLFDLDEKDRGNTELSGFSVDRQGNVLMTVAVLFRAFVLSPDGTLRSFGKPSSAPGGFNITAGIARDDKGNVLVVDRLKGAVLLFNSNLTFVTQFASYGHRPGQLIFPDDMVVGGHDSVYVAQMGKRGVSVFRLSYP